LPHKPRIPKYLDCWIAIRTKSPGYEVTIRNNENQEFTATIELNPDDYDIKQLFTRVTSPHIYGEKLFSAVFFDRVIYSTYSSFQQDASRLNKGLRIRLSMDDVRLSNLAWELLFDSDPHQNHFIGLYKKSPIIRSLDLRFPARPIKTKYPLKILGLAITPENLPKLEIEQEKSLIEQTLHGLINDGKVFLKWSSASTWDGFQREVRTGEWNILHYIGHSGLNPNHGGEIYFEEPKPTSAEDFAMPLHDCPSLKLVVLNSCESAGSAIGSNGFSSLAATLVKAGVPAVVAMQGRIMDDHAIFLAYKFYEALVDGLPIEAALSEARQNLKHAFNEDDFYWALPVLFMRSVDGKLFNFSV
jgi:CHAT domain-containing protein